LLYAECCMLYAVCCMRYAVCCLLYATTPLAVLFVIYAVCSRVLAEPSLAELPLAQVPRVVHCMRYAE
jgi:hypothetical protein